MNKSTDVFSTGNLAIDSTLTNGPSELTFLNKKPPYSAFSGGYYALSSAQADDPSLRIKQYNQSGEFLNFGYLYDTQFNPIPPGTRVSVAVRLCKAFPILDTTVTLCALLNFSRFLWPCLTNS
jgi:hypothetical protein